MFDTLFNIMFIPVLIMILVVLIIIIYFIIRAFRASNKRSEQMSPTKQYPETVFKKKEKATFCKYCGSKFTEYLKICPECGEEQNN